MNRIAIIEKTKKYVTVRIPRHLSDKLGLSSSTLTEAEAFAILSEGMREAKQGKTKVLHSLKDLRS